MYAYILCTSVQGLLNHTVIQEVEELDGRYKQAFDRIINQVASLGGCGMHVAKTHAVC